MIPSRGRAVLEGFLTRSSSSEMNRTLSTCLRRSGVTGDVAAMFKTV